MRKAGGHREIRASSGCSDCGFHRQRRHQRPLDIDREGFVDVIGEDIAHDIGDDLDDLLVAQSSFARGSELRVPEMTAIGENCRRQTQDRRTLRIGAAPTPRIAQVNDGIGFVGSGAVK